MASLLLAESGVKINTKKGLTVLCKSDIFISVAAKQQKNFAAAVKTVDRFLSARYNKKVASKKR